MAFSVRLMKMRKISAVFFLIFCLTFFASAQTDTEALRTLGKTLLDKNVSDSVKYVNAAKFQNMFEAEIMGQGADWVNMESLPFISRLTSNDKNTEIFTWALKRAEDSYKHYGFVYTKATKKTEAKIIRFEDKAETIKNSETKNLGKSSWLGCVYYSLVDISKGNKKMFLVLGYGGHNPLVRRKVADIITFNNVGDVQFGAPVFEKDKRTFNRVVLEFSAQASVTMKFNAEQQTLFYDYLVPVSNIYLGNPAFYGPNGSYDAFQLKGQKFIYVKDVDARNETEEKGNRTKKVESKLPPR